jgi:hypothetical protein
MGIANAQTRRAATCILRVPRADAPLDLNSRHRSDGVKSPELRRRDFAEADVLDEPFTLQTTLHHRPQSKCGGSSRDLQLFQRMSHVLDGHLGAHAVHVIQINVAAAQPLERICQLLSDAFESSAVRHARWHEFGRHHCDATGQHTSPTRCCCRTRVPNFSRPNFSRARPTSDSL